MHRKLILAVGLMAFVLPVWAKEAPPSPQPPKPAAPKPATQGEAIDDAVQYKHCVALARQKPDEGWEESLAWASLGGGEAARHCGAIALIGLRQYEEAASRLEALAKASHRPAKLRAGMLAQAGQAWLLAGKTDRAYAAQTAALSLVPVAPDLLVDRAQTLAEAKNYKEALVDLNQALAVDPRRVDAYVFRATAKRYLDDLKGAAADLAQALALDPQNEDAWLESGMVKRLQNDGNGARKDWLKVLELAPNSAAADTARRNIELLDVKGR
jgi:tetratricopeptide (TPR) repeat protein